MHYLVKLRHIVDMLADMHDAHATHSAKETMDEIMSLLENTKPQPNNL